ncbi:MAG: flagellar brake protein [Ectothiorhodospiraceae bacterium]|nr:flagellar brake protein [Ectothiorhodospiraceae bacterium]MCH8505372.1 flagellar brake protein [Ectothiorhodospiraceae bacterium]
MATDHRPNIGADAEQDRFLLTGRPQVIAVMRSLQRKPEIVTAHFDAGKRFLVTAVLGVDADNDRLILDYGPDREMNARALLADRFVCVAKQSNISVKFPCGRLTAGEHEGGPAFFTSIPEQVYRLQRREYFRVPAPVGNPLYCTLADPDDESRTYRMRVMDLSLGGLGLIDPDMNLPLQLRQGFPSCRLQLPGGGEMEVALEVRNISRYLLRDGRPGRRIGMAFGQLSQSQSNQVQRYLHQLQIAERDTRPE